MSVRKTILTFLLSGSATLAWATTPVVVVQSPANGASAGSPVNFVASASSSGCAKGIAAMRIYTAPGINAYTVNENALNTNINLPLGSYSTVVQAWDNCGGVGKTTVNIKVSKINLPPPRFLYATEFQAGRIAGICGESFNRLNQPNQSRFHVGTLGPGGHCIRRGRVSPLCRQSGFSRS